MFNGSLHSILSLSHSQTCSKFKILKYYFRLSEISDYLFVCNLQAKIQTISNAECNKRFTAITEKHMCVHDVDTPSTSRPRACNGDSGGPVVMCGSEHNVLVGVISYGKFGNCSAHWPEVCTRVSEYRDWIQKNTDIFRRGMFVSLSFCRSDSDQTISPFLNKKKSKIGNYSKNYSLSYVSIL